MASIKIKFRPSNVNGHEGTVYYQIIHDLKSRQLATNYRIFPSEWNEKRSSIATPIVGERSTYLYSIRERINWDVEGLTKIIRRLESGCLTFTSDDMIEEFHRYRSEYSLLNYVETQIVKLRHNGQVRTAETYRSALNSFLTFNEGEDIMLDSITSETIEAYEAWLKHKSVSKNTISFYMRVLRAIYKRAVEGGIIEDRNPFRRVYTGVDKTVKRALPLQVIKNIKKMDLSGSPRLDYARDIFMLSFMLRGMSFIDMAFLKKTDRSNGFVIYTRHKTGQQLTIEWTREMQDILDKYPANPTAYLLPIITSSGINERCAYRNALFKINKRLKEIDGMLKLPIPLTLYVARHSWVSVAKAQGVPVSVISEGLGHDSEATTQIYLASLDSSVVDRANSMILKSLI